MLRAKILLGVIALWSVRRTRAARTCTRRLRTSRTIPFATCARRS